MKSFVISIIDKGRENTIDNIKPNRAIMNNSNKLLNFITKGTLE
jgi:hypothetical protein